MTNTKRRKSWLLAADALVIPGMFLCRWLSGFLLSSTSSECAWYRFGGKCVTCGGTHFVQAFLNGQFGAAFGHNQFLFVLTIFLAISFLLLNLHWLFQVEFAKKILTRVYTIWGLVIWVILMFVFLFLRNIPVIIRIYEILSSR